MNIYEHMNTTGNTIQPFSDIKSTKTLIMIMNINNNNLLVPLFNIESTKMTTNNTDYIITVPQPSFKNLSKIHPETGEKAPARKTHAAKKTRNGRRGPLTATPVIHAAFAEIYVYSAITRLGHNLR